ncbi:MAG TPA: formate dehydrogenase subunit alpha [Gemmatimonadales bacterium]|jgi:formate dehydrogenase major subunit|nr:formate dehydrogenase subunit alpha [Gemmatimonadales bacterium]
MPTLTINGRAVTADDGRTILEAARAAGIEIPTLCWYPKLPIVGNCRICLVSVEGQPKLLPACAAKVADGMVVTTESHAAVENRKGVLRLLLERYPADHLRNGGRASPRNEFEQYVVRYGVGPTAVTGRDLPLRSGDERPGDPMIRHDMSTCILCTRCVRACEDIQVVGVLDVGWRGAHAEIIVGADGDPDKAGCTWCGECVRVCPTGAIFEVMPRQRFAPEQVRRPDRVVRSVCPYCGVGCQVDLHVAGNQVVRVTSPDIELNTPNQGSTCVKGRFGYDFPQHRDRLTRPLVRKGWIKEGTRWVWRGPRDRRDGPWRTIEGEGQQDKPGTPPRATGKSVRELPLLQRLDLDIRDRVATPADWYAPFREASWEEALELTAQELARIKAERGGNALACFSSAKCSNEENYLIMRMFRGALGTNNVDHCTRLCHSTSVAAMQRAINTAAASGSMREIEEACDVIFIAGANTTESHPVFGAAIKRAHEHGATLIVADPRRTELAGRADIHLQMQPGTDVALYSAMLNHILARGLENRAFIAARTHDFEQVRAAVQPYTPEKAAKITGIPAERIRRAAETYARGPNTSTLWAMGLTQHANGTDIVTSLLNLMFACGMIGRWGAAMLPIRGQNNVQGASDVGAIPFVYTDYQPVGDARVRERFATVWGVPAESLSLQKGLMVTEVVKPESGIRGMYIMGENPIISDPDIAHAEHWFRELEFLAVQDLFLTETARYADVVLPGASFAEKTGTFVNTERRIQLSHRAVDPPGQARGDLEILIDLSNRLGLATPFRSAEEVMREVTQVTPSWAGVTHQRLEGAGLQYPVPAPDHPGTAFLFDQAFPTTDGRATFVAVQYTDPVELPDDDYPFVMNTGRQLYHWHTGTMTRRATGLDAREPTAIVEIHPADAKALGVAEGELVRLTSRRNSMVTACRVSDRVARGQVFVPFHFREAAANLLTNPILDPYAKMAELKVCAVRVEAVRAPAAV